MAYFCSPSAALPSVSYTGRLASRNGKIPAHDFVSDNLLITMKMPLYPFLRLISTIEESEILCGQSSHQHPYRRLKFTSVHPPDLQDRGSFFTAGESQQRLRRPDIRNVMLGMWNKASLLKVSCGGTRQDPCVKIGGTWLVLRISASGVCWWIVQIF